MNLIGVDVGISESQKKTLQHVSSEVLVFLYPWERYRIFNKLIGPCPWDEPGHFSIFM